MIENQSIDGSRGLVFDQPAVVCELRRILGMRGPTSAAARLGTAQPPPQDPQGPPGRAPGARRGARAPGRPRRRRDLLIEHLHLIQDRYGHLSAAHLAALAEEMKLRAHRGVRGRDLLRPFRRGEGRRDAAARRHGARVISFSCAMAGAEHLLRILAGQARPRRAGRARLAWAPATARRSAPSAIPR